MTAEKLEAEARAVATEAADSIEWAMENFMPAKGETGAGCRRRRTIEAFTEAMLAYRDQVRREVDWQPMDVVPEEGASLVFWIPAGRHEQTVPGQDYSLQLGFYARGAFLEQGTGHDMRERLESWGGDGETYPAMWRRVYAPALSAAAPGEGG